MCACGPDLRGHALRHLLFDRAHRWHGNLHHALSHPHGGCGQRAAGGLSSRMMVKMAFKIIQTLVTCNQFNIKDIKVMKRTPSTFFRVKGLDALPQLVHASSMFERGRNFVSRVSQLKWAKGPSEEAGARDRRVDQSLHRGAGADQTWQRSKTEFLVCFPQVLVSLAILFVHLVCLALLFLSLLLEQYNYRISQAT